MNAEEARTALMGSGTLTEVVRRLFHRRSAVCQTKRNDVVKHNSNDRSETEDLKLIQVPNRTFYRLVSTDTHKLVSQSTCTLSHLFLDICLFYVHDYL